MWNSGKWRDRDLITDLTGKWLWIYWESIAALNEVQYWDVWCFFLNIIFDVLFDEFWRMTICLFHGFEYVFNFFSQKMMFDGLFTDGEFMTLFSAFLGEVVGIGFFSVQYPSWTSKLAGCQITSTWKVQIISNNIQYMIYRCFFCGLYFAILDYGSRHDFEWRSNIKAIGYLIYLSFLYSIHYLADTRLNIQQRCMICNICFRQLRHLMIFWHIDTWNPKQPDFIGCFNWMIQNLYLRNGCFTKHPFKSGCLGFQVQVINLCFWCAFNSSLSPWSEQLFPFCGHIDTSEAKFAPRCSMAARRLGYQKKTYLWWMWFFFWILAIAVETILWLGQRYLWILVLYQWAYWVGSFLNRSNCSGLAMFLLAVKPVGQNNASCVEETRQCECVLSFPEGSISTWNPKHTLLNGCLVKQPFLK